MDVMGNHSSRPVLTQRGGDRVRDASVELPIVEGTTRKVDGKTVTKLLTPEQLARYQPWLDNARRLRELVSELETLTSRP